MLFTVVIGMPTIRYVEHLSAMEVLPVILERVLELLYETVVCRQFFALWKHFKPATQDGSSCDEPFG